MPTHASATFRIVFNCRGEGGQGTFVDGLSYTHVFCATPNSTTVLDPWYRYQQRCCANMTTDVRVGKI